MSLTIAIYEPTTLQPPTGLFIFRSITLHVRIRKGLIYPCLQNNPWCDQTLTSRLIKPYKTAELERVRAEQRSASAEHLTANLLMRNGGRFKHITTHTLDSSWGIYLQSNTSFSSDKCVIFTCVGGSRWRGRLRCLARPSRRAPTHQPEVGRWR